MITPTVDWFSDHPVNMYQVCSRLREAVEERELFFRISDGEKRYPLALPYAPAALYHMSYNQAQNGKLTFIEKFASNLHARISDLLRNSFNWQCFNAWSKYVPWVNENDGKIFCESLGVDWEGFRSGGYPHLYRPFRYEDMRFFYAAAALLDRAALYPAPPEFFDNGLQKHGTVFGMDCHVSFHDKINGNIQSGDFQPDGQKFNTSDGAAISISPRDAAGYMMLKNSGGEVIREYQYRADEHRIFYKTNGIIESAGVGGWRGNLIPLTGDFEIKLHIGASFQKAGGNSSETVENIVKITPENSGSRVDLSLWTELMNECLKKREDGNNSAATFYFSSNEIKLSAENYPALPYKYLNYKQ